MKVRVFESADALAAELASRLAAELGEGDMRGLMLAGGKTPLSAYAALPVLRRGAAASSARVILSDERMVPPDSPDCNHRNIAPSLVAAGVAPECVMSVDTSGTLERAAALFDAALARLLDSGTRLRFGLLGVGADGHTASMFSPADVAAAERSERLAVAVARPAPPDRISVTPSLLRRVEDLTFVIAGADKAAIVRTLVERPGTIPAGLAVAGHPCVSLWTDRAAWGGRPA